MQGLVDLQVNGYKGVNFCSDDLTPEEFERACRGVFDAGTTAFLPTMITSPPQVYQRNLPIMAAALQSEEFRGQLLGIHLEGPFISAQDGARGAHDRRWTGEPDASYLEKLIGWADGRVKMITIAAELDGADELARYATRLGITVSLGHQMAAEQDVCRLVEAGAVCLTHLGNGVPALLGRHANPIWTGLANDELTAMIITDGHHLPASVIKTIIRTKGVERCVVVSDASSPAGLGPGRYNVLGTEVVLDDNGRLYDPVGGYLAGSSSTMLECMNYLASLDLVGADELMAMGFHNPLKLIGLGPEDVVSTQDIVFDKKRRVFCAGKQQKAVARKKIDCAP
ncbi:MAG: N-acetylglucosamine-6-phosphate deacetylase [Planctomycetota bacterium]